MTGLAILNALGQDINSANSFDASLSFETELYLILQCTSAATIPAQADSDDG